MTERLTALAAEIEQHVAETGWDQPPRLYALVPTAELVAQEPALAAQLGLDGDTTPQGALTPVEQEPLPEGPLDEVLAGIAWSDDVAGCALAHEALVLPPSVEAEAPDDVDDATLTQWAAEHPDRREVRITVAVLRDGSRGAVLRLRTASETEPDDLLTGDDLAPNLADALLDTLT